MMGNYINKYFPHDNDNEKEEVRNTSFELKNEVNIEQDSMLTPPLVSKTLPIDPRSITTGIERTPIEVSCKSLGLNNKRLSAIPKHLQIKPYLETDVDQIMACLTPKKHFPPRVLESTKLQFPDTPNKDAEIPSTPVCDNPKDEKTISSIERERFEILGIDPRSPATNFDRTPILMPKSLERFKARSREELHRQGSYDTDIFYPKFSYCEMSSDFEVPEIQALPDLAACTKKSLDLDDTECVDKSSESESSHSDCSSETETVFRDEKSLENQDETQTVLKQSDYNDTYIKKDVKYKEMSINDNDTIKVWTDTVVLDKLLESGSNESHDAQIVQKTLSQMSKVLITYDDNTIIKDVQSLKISQSENDTGVRKKKAKSDIKTDEKKTFNLNDKNDSEFMKVRTPLGNRSNNGQVQTLSTKSPQQIFRNKGITTKMIQENTPPHKKYVVKSKLSGTQWDPDSTVVI